MWPVETDLSVVGNGDESVVQARCALDAQTSVALERLVAGAIARGARAIALDLEHCPLLDTLGVRALIRIRRRADHAGIPLRLSRCSAPVERMLRRMHLDTLFGLPAATSSESSSSSADALLGVRSALGPPSP
jgi:anti-anti-sigma factor